jgi:hypothetical protein
MPGHVQAISGTTPVRAFHTGLPRVGLKRASRGAARLALVAGAVLVLVGCSKNAGSFDVDDSPQTKWNNLVALVQFKKLPNQPKPTDPIQCPEIQVLNGNADDRVYAPGDQTNENVRYQFSIGDFARDCVVKGGQMSMKIGVEGRALLGPAGSPGTLTAPIRVAIIQISDETPVANKLYPVAVTVPANQTEAPFTFVTEPLSVPVTSAHPALDYRIKVGFDSAGNGAKQPEAEASGNAEAAAAAPASADQPMHHHHHHGNFGGGGGASPD